MPSSTLSARGELGTYCPMTFQNGRPGESRLLSGRCWIWGRQVYVIGSRLADSGELLILITNARPETALRDYAQRWSIEPLFGALKI